MDCRYCTDDEKGEYEIRDKFTYPREKAFEEPDGNYIDEYGRKPEYIVVVDMKNGDRWLFEGEDEGCAIANGVAWLEKNSLDVYDMEIYTDWCDEDYVNGEYVGRENRTYDW